MGVALEELLIWWEAGLFDWLESGTPMSGL